MIRMTVLYRRTDGSHFDFGYYVEHHISLAKRLLSDCGLCSIEVQKCVRTLAGNEPDLLCITHIDFENAANLTKALEIHGAELKADFSKYTNVDPETYLCDLL